MLKCGKRIFQKEPLKLQKITRLRLNHGIYLEVLCARIYIIIYLYYVIRETRVCARN